MTRCPHRQGCSLDSVDAPTPAFGRLSVALCPSCRESADACSYPGEARPGCLLDKRKRQVLTARSDPNGTKYTVARIKLRAIFPDATRVEITPQWLEVEGLPLLPLPSLSLVLKVLTKVWGEDTHVTPDFSADAELLRIERGLK